VRRRNLIFLWVLVLVGCGAGVIPTPATLAPTLAPTAPIQTAAPVAVSNNAVLGPLVGAVTDTSATVWLRTDKPAHVELTYGNPPRTVTAQTDANSNFTTKLQMTSLAPQTEYAYELKIDGQPFYSGALTTFPPRGDSKPFRFVVLTDFRTVSKINQPVATFKNAAQENPAFVIIGGDFDHRNPNTLEDKRQMFRDLYTADNGMQDFVNLILHKFPLVHLWDDHDFGANNSDKTYSHAAESLQVLNEYFPTYPMTQYGDWQQFSYGSADFWLLDSRSQRDPWKQGAMQGKSMLDGNHLGANGQLEWLLNGLKNSTAKWKFIVSPVVLNPTTKEWDAWGAYPDERRQILDFIKHNNIPGVIVLSGDLHAGGIDDGRNSGLPEMLAPAANDGFDTRCLTEPQNQIGKWSVGSFGDRNNTPCNGYGVVEVSPDAVNLIVKDSNGNEKIQYQVSSNR